MWYFWRGRGGAHQKSSFLSKHTRMRIRKALICGASVFTKSVWYKIIPLQTCMRWENMSLHATQCVVRLQKCVDRTARIIWKQYISRHEIPRSPCMKCAGLQHLIISSFLHFCPFFCSQFFFSHRLLNSCWQCIKFCSYFVVFFWCRGKISYPQHGCLVEWDGRGEGGGAHEEKLGLSSTPRRRGGHLHFLTVL